MRKHISVYTYFYTAELKKGQFGCFLNESNFQCLIVYN
jgi:hypothetical protein